MQFPNFKLATNRLGELSGKIDTFLFDTYTIVDSTYTFR